jgi:hypothetical protein
MADEDNKGLPKVDRRGTTILVPLGIGAVLVLIAVLMIVRNSGDVPPVPTPSGGAITQPKSE